MKFHPTQIVRPATEEDARALCNGFVEKVTIDTQLEVLLVVHDAQDYHREANGEHKHQSGLIVKHLGQKRNGGLGYPYVWDFKRFVPVN